MCLGGGVSKKATTLPAEPLFTLSENTREVIQKVRCIDPPFFKMYSPASPASLLLGCPTRDSTELFIDPEKHRCLAISLSLSQEECPKAKYKAGQVLTLPDGSKTKGTKRIMEIRLEKDFNLGLRRDDQTIEYQVEWISEEMKRSWVAVRSEFLALCQAQPELTKTIQNCMLQEMVSNDPFKEQVEAHCFSANAWMVKQHEQLFWRKASCFSSEVAWLIFQDDFPSVWLGFQAQRVSLALGKETSPVASMNELKEEDSAPEVVIKGAAQGGRWEEDLCDSRAMINEELESRSWFDQMEDDDAFDLSQRWKKDAA